MYTVIENKQARKAIRKVPPQVRNAFLAWLQTARAEGPEGLKAKAGYNDERLSGVWDGHRSSRLSLQYRVIYRVRRDVLTIIAVSITAHDYRRK